MRSTCTILALLHLAAEGFALDFGRVELQGLGVLGLGFRVQGFGFRVLGLMLTSH